MRGVLALSDVPQASRIAGLPADRYGEIAITFEIALFFIYVQSMPSICSWDTPPGKKKGPRNFGAPLGKNLWMNQLKSSPPEPRDGVKE